MLYYFLLYSEVNQPYVHTSPLFFGLPFHLGHHRGLRRAPWGVQQALVSYTSDGVMRWETGTDAK